MPLALREWDHSALLGVEVMGHRVKSSCGRSVLVPHRRHFREPLALKRCELSILDAHNSDRLRRGNLLPLVVPVLARSDKFLADTGSDRRVLEPFDQLRVAAIMRPGRNECGKGVEPGGAMLLGQTGWDRRVLEPFDQLRVAAIMRPGRNECGKGVEPGGVSVGGCADVRAEEHTSEL